MTTPEITPVGGPVSTFISTCDTNGITLIQRRGGGVVHLTPDDAYGLLHTLLTELRSFDFPEMIVVQDVEVQTMICPRCGNETEAGGEAAVDVMDFDIRRTGGFPEGTPESPELHVSYDSETNYELLLIECASCHDPVSLPKNVIEIN